tara:strand:+ start:1053 stop:1925 length:873 start_codon:yes stop_codon:yes gene_type:complete
MEIDFIKYHGAGNDYIAIDGRSLEIDWGNLSKDMSKPHFGIFSDGIVVVFDSKIADVKMRIFNPDGSEAEMSGNGVRLFSKFVLDNKIYEAGSRKTLTVETGGGVREVFPKFDDDGQMVSAKVAMGKPKFNRDDIPVNPILYKENSPVFDHEITIDDYSLRISCVNIGNPHAVMITDKDVDRIDLSKIGPLVENSELFPNRINFEIVNIISRDTIKARIFERGAGETLSSGTGTSACGIICIKKGLVDEKVRVMVPGGFLDINWKAGDEAYLEGPTEKVFSGTWNIKEEN